MALEMYGFFGFSFSNDPDNLNNINLLLMVVKFSIKRNQVDTQTQSEWMNKIRVSHFWNYFLFKKGGGVR